MSSTYNYLLADCARHFGLVDIDGFINTGLLQLDDNNIVIEYQGVVNNQEFLLLYTKLGCPHHPDIGLFSKLLEANLFWAGTGGSTLGLNAETGDIYLSYQQRFDGLTGADLTAMLTQFSNIATYWRGIVNDR